MRALLVEDAATIAQSIELMLKSENFNTYTMDLGEEGVDLGKLYDYDCILLETPAAKPSGRYALSTNACSNRGRRMNKSDSGSVGRAETRSARKAERAFIAAAVWSERAAEEQIVNDRIVHLRAARLARDADLKLTVVSAKARKRAACA